MKGINVNGQLKNDNRIFWKFKIKYKTSYMIKKKKKSER